MGNDSIMLSVHDKCRSGRELDIGLPFMSDTNFSVRKTGVSDGLVGYLLLGGKNGGIGRQ